MRRLISRVGKTITNTKNSGSLLGEFLKGPTKIAYGPMLTALTGVVLLDMYVCREENLISQANVLRASASAQTKEGNKS